MHSQPGYDFLLSSNGGATFWSKTDTGLPRHGVQFQGNTLSAAVLDTSVNRTSTNVVDGTHFFNDSAWRVYTARRVVDTLEIRVNGVVEATGKASTIASENVDQVGQLVYIGGTNVSGTPSGLMIGDIAELVAVKGALTDANLVKLEGYLKTRYAL